MSLKKNKRKGKFVNFVIKDKCLIYVVELIVRHLVQFVKSEIIPQYLMLYLKHSRLASSRRQ